MDVHGMHSTLPQTRASADHRRADPATEMGFPSAHSPLPPRLQQLQQRLLQDRLLTPEQARQLSGPAHPPGSSWVRCLLQLPGLVHARVLPLLAAAYGIPVLTLDACVRDHLESPDAYPIPTRRFPAWPLRRSAQTLHLAIADPSDTQILEAFAFASGLSVEPILVAEGTLQRWRTEWLGLPAPLTQAIHALENDASDHPSSAERPVIRFVRELLHEALRLRASDIHLEPGADHYRLRLRVDGLLQDMGRVSTHQAPALTAHLKVLASLDISEKRLPQDGRLQVSTADTTVECRVSSLPTVHGEKLVLRLLHSSTHLRRLDALGFEARQLTAYVRALEQPQGLLLVVGPTGSGKTATLFSGLAHLNTAERNLSTVEDPVEIHLPGVNQVSVQTGIGLSFATLLRALLRQDPDVLLVGEIRDRETAEIAIQGAQTGHLVLSTLHTQDCLQTLPRLIAMGIPGFQLASAVTLILAQRLVRCLCPHCRIPRTAAEAPRSTPESRALRANGSSTTEFRAYPPGCSHCTHGYQGRTGIYQVLPVTDALRAGIAAGSSQAALTRLAQMAGSANWQEAAARKLAAGITSREEVRRVLGPSQEESQEESQEKTS